MTRVHCEVQAAVGCTDIVTGLVVRDHGSAADTRVAGTLVRCAAHGLDGGG